MLWLLVHDQTVVLCIHVLSMVPNVEEAQHVSRAWTLRLQHTLPIITDTAIQVNLIYHRTRWALGTLLNLPASLE